jgi:flotillin
MSVVNNTNSNNQENIKSLPFYKTPTFITTASSVTLFGLWCLTRIHISKPNQYLVKTGMGIKEMKIGRNAIQWPFQQIINVDLNPKTISFDLKGMTEEKLQFKLPTVLTYTPCDPSEDPDGFKRYAKMMTEITPEQVAEIILGVAEGEVRTRTATMSVEQLFNDGASFRETVIKAVQEDLKQFGIFVRFGNFQELQDTSNHNYFGMRSTRAIEMANYEAQSNAAQSKRDGEISMENSKTTTRIAVAEAQK